MSERERDGDTPWRELHTPGYELRLDPREVLEEAEAMASFGSWASDLKTRSVFWSREARRIFGVASDTAVSVESYYSLVHPEDRERIRAQIAAALARGDEFYEVEHRIVRPDGSERWLRGRGRVRRDAEGKALGVLGVIRDITEQKTAQREQFAIAERYQQIAAIVEWANDAIIGCDLEGRILSWNRGAARLYGYEEAEVLQQSIAIIVPDALRGQELERRNRVRTGVALPDFDTVRKRKDGSFVEVSVSMSPIRDADGQVVAISKTARDLTSQRHAEQQLRRAEQRMRDAQKLEAVGLLAGGIAHDFNNTLSAIVGYTELVLDSLPVGDPIRADLVEVRKAGASAVSMTRQLLALSRRQVLQPRVIDLNQVVLGLERMIRRLVGANVVLEFELSPELGRVRVDPVQLEHVIMNLVLNARDALPMRGTISITSDNVSVAQQRAELALPPGEYVCLQVRDTGSGMDEATVARIFEPFFTTKEKGRGTGLGLSTALGIVQQSGGHMEVESELGRGTTFRVYLPRTERPLQNAYSLPPQGQTNCWETVLLVEDEDQVRALARISLRRQGYQVLEAEQGEQALALCEQHIGTIHLLLTDVVMPRMGGRELAARAAVLRPEMKVLYMTGYASDEILPEGIVEGQAPLLHKPVTPNALARRVREVLDSP